MAKLSEKIKVPIFIRRKGADAFRPALAAGGSLMAYECLSLCDFFIVQHFFKLCHICLVLFENLRGLYFHIGIIRHLREILHQEINILLDSPDAFVELPAPAPDPKKTDTPKESGTCISAGTLPMIRIKNTRGLSAEIFSGTSPEMLCHLIKAFTHAE